MHKTLTRTLATLALVCAAGVASATQYPNGTCVDSVTIRSIQNAASLCHPVSPDTVRGVGGIVVGQDPIATGFDNYLQNTGGGPFSGIDFFTHGVNTAAAPYNFAIGDSLVVEFASVSEFQNATEVLATNNNFGAPNFVVRKVSSGNALPPFFVATTTQLNELPTNVFAEQYEHCLVKINGPLTVVRNTASGGMGVGNIPGTNATNAFMVVSASSPSDSVYIDGFKLTNYAPPSIGTSIFSVQGILNQNLRGYRIMLRNGNDIVVNTPPNVTDAYPMSDNIIKVIYDRDVTVGSATTLSNYSLASFGSVNSAIMDGTSAVRLNITNGLAHGDLEVVTVNGVTGLAAGQTMTTPQSRTFYNGLLTAEEVERANPDSLSATPPCVDRSRFAGDAGQISQGLVGIRASMAGVVGAKYGTVYYMMDGTGIKRGGVAAFAPPATLTVGHRYRLTGGVQEFFGETEFSNIIEVQDLGALAVPGILATTVNIAARDTCDYSNVLNDGEDHEGTFVKLPYVKVVQRFSPLPTNGFHVADQSYPDTIFVENFNGVLGVSGGPPPAWAPPLGNVVSITGVLHYSGGSFRVVPRDLADIVNHGVAGVDGNTGRLSFAVAGNPSRTPKFNWTLPQAEDVEIGIFDVAGRQVANVWSGHLPAGTYSKEWAGKDDGGREVNAGVYFARMKAGGVMQSLRTVYLGR